MCSCLRRHNLIGYDLTGLGFQPVTLCVHAAQFTRSGLGTVGTTHRMRHQNTLLAHQKGFAVGPASIEIGFLEGGACKANRETQALLLVQTIESALISLVETAAGTIGGFLERAMGADQHCIG